MTPWQTLPVRRLFEVVNGGTPTSEVSNWGEDVPWATPIDLAQVDGGVLSGTDRMLTEQGLSAGSQAVPAGSLVVSTRAPIGYVAETAERTAFNQGCRGLRPKTRLNLRFFRYQFSSLAERLQAWGQGSTFLELSGDALAAFPLRAPPLASQLAIADYLDRETVRIDALVRMKRQMIGLLDERSDAFIASHMASLTTRTALLGHTSHIHSGAGFPHDYQGRNSGEIPFYKVIDLAGSEDGRTINRASNWISGSEVRELKCHPAPPNAILFPKVGAALLANQRRITTVRAAFDNNLMAVTPEGHDPRFLRYYLTLIDLGELANPGPVPSINEDVVSALRVPIPPLATQQEVADELDAAMNLSSATTRRLRRQVDLLAEHRQALVTAAVTGQLEIPEAA